MERVISRDGTAIAYDRSGRGPALVVNGTALPFMLDAAKGLAEAMPYTQHPTLEGQSHNVGVQVLAPLLIEVFDQGGSR